MQIRFFDAAGTEHVVDGAAGENAMTCATRHLIPGIVGECGGALACATCHGYVSDPWAATLPPPSAHESAMLDGCIDVRPNSRLTCQLTLTPSLDGLTIHVPQSQT